MHPLSPIYLTKSNCTITKSIVLKTDTHFFLYPSQNPLCQNNECVKYFLILAQPGFCTVHIHLYPKRFENVGELHFVFANAPVRASFSNYHVHSPGTKEPGHGKDKIKDNRFRFPVSPIAKVLPTCAPTTTRIGSGALVVDFDAISRCSPGGYFCASHVIDPHISDTGRVNSTESSIGTRRKVFLQIWCY